MPLAFVLIDVEPGMEKELVEELKKIGEQICIYKQLRA